MEHNTKEYRRRPLEQVSRKKYGAALAVLKEACKSPTLSMTKRLRAVELICLIYGLDPHIPNRRDRRSVKALVSEDAFERELRQRVRDGVLSQTMREARQAAERYLQAQQTDSTDNAKQYEVLSGIVQDDARPAVERDAAARALLQTTPDTDLEHREVQDEEQQQVAIKALFSQALGASDASA